MSFVHEIRVRYGEVDASGTVFNAHWLTYADDAFTRFLGHVGFGVDAVDRHGFDCLMVHADLDWRGSAGFADHIGLEVGIARVGTSSFDLTCIYRLRGRIVVAALLTYVTVVPGERTSTAVPDRVRSVFQEHVLALPDPDGRRG